MAAEKVYIEAPCKECKKPIGHDVRIGSQWKNHYDDSSGREHKTCWQARHMRKVKV